MQDIPFFCGEDKSSDNEEESNVEEKDWNYSHTALIKQANTTHNRLVNTRQSSSTSLFPEDRTNNDKDNVLPNTSDNQSDQNSNAERHTTLWNGVEGFDTVLKLVKGSLLGGDQYSDMYAEIDIPIKTMMTSSDVSVYIQNYLVPIWILWLKCQHSAVWHKWLHEKKELFLMKSNT